MKKGIKATVVMTLTFAAAMNMNGCGVYGAPMAEPAPSVYDDSVEMDESVESRDSVELDEEDDFDVSDNMNEAAYGAPFG